MSAPLGISVSQGAVRAVLLADGRIVWAGAAEWTVPADLTEAVARLASEAGRSVRRVRVVLERELVQTRTVAPAPLLRGAAVRRYVALEAPRLFRKNGAPLVTDAAIVVVDRTARALWAAATIEPVVQAVLDGCAEAGLAVEGLGPAADVLPLAAQASAQDGGELVFPNGTTAEVLTVGAGGTWRSRLVTGTREAQLAWSPALAALGAEAKHFAGAYAAGLAETKLSLLPADARAARERAARRRLVRLGALAGVLWLLAGTIFGFRLYASGVAAQRELESHAGALDSALALRRELAAGRAALEQFAAAEHARSRHLALLAGITNALGDSAFLVTARVGPDGVVRLVGFAPSAVRVVADLEKLSALGGVRLEAPVTRERTADGAERDRFAIVAQLGGGRGQPR